MMEANVNEMRPRFYCTRTDVPARVHYQDRLLQMNGAAAWKLVHVAPLHKGVIESRQ